jgi:hypothetical protein
MHAFERRKLARAPCDTSAVLVQRSRAHEDKRANICTEVLRARATVTVLRLERRRCAPAHPILTTTSSDRREDCRLSTPAELVTSSSNGAVTGIDEISRILANVAVDL